MGKLDGKIAIVVGSSRGIGKGIALFYGREGAQVVVVARSEEQGKLPGTIGQTVEEIKAEGAPPCLCAATSYRRMTWRRWSKPSYGSSDGWTSW